MEASTGPVKASPEFRAEVRKVLFAIVKFALFYLLLIVGALVLLVLSLYLGIGLIMLRPSFITLAAGLGIMSVGVMICVFLVKFIFSRTRTEDPVRIEVTERDQPELIVMVHAIADEVQAPRPKHIYLIPDVNASVSYDSTFWSMFLPVRKNLRIGLGLVNALNVSELRAVIAHEFGHFSQRSMKLGSYVYTVNRTIHDLVQHRDSWDRALQGWAEAGGIFGWFALPTFYIVRSVRQALVWAYGWVNRSHMSLSRQMEFHADAIAASVAGGDHLVEALYKAEYAGLAWDGALNGLGHSFSKGAIATDVYGIHSKQVTFQRSLGSEVPADQVLDDIRRERIQYRGRLVIKDQWASHPSLEEREQHALNLSKGHTRDARSSWVLFTDADRVRSNMTELLYKNAGERPKGTKPLDPDRYLDELRSNADRFALHPIFNKFYEGRVPVLTPLENLTAERLAQAEDPRSLLKPEYSERTERWLQGRSDLMTIQAIADGAIDVESFDLDGQKYTKKEASACAERIAKELNEEEAWLRELDLRIQTANLAAAERSGHSAALRAGMQAFIQWNEQAVAITGIFEKGQEVHARLASKERFEEHEWKSIGHDAEHVQVLLLGHLQNHDHREALTEEDHQEEIRVFDRVARHSGAPSTFEVEHFMGVLRAIAVLEQAVAIRTREALKRFTDVQLAWLEPAAVPGH
ncbi:MAG: M48 family metallopeptidase [Flavobacteriales bacterium]